MERVVDQTEQFEAYLAQLESKGGEYVALSSPEAAIGMDQLSWVWQRSEPVGSMTGSYLGPHGGNLSSVSADQLSHVPGVQVRRRKP